MTRVLLPLLALLLVSADAPRPLDALTRVLATSADEAVQLDVLTGMAEALAGRKSIRAPAGWDAVHRRLSVARSAEVRRRVMQLSLLFGDPGALKELRRTAGDTKAPREDRAFALTALLDRADPETLPLVQRLIDDPDLGRAALRGLARFDEKATPSLVLDRYAKLDRDAKEDAVGTLASRPAWALALLDAIEKKRLPAADVSAYWARQMAALKDRQVSARLEAVWGTIRPAAKDRDALLKKYLKVAAPDRLAKANRSHGRALYAKTCASCHALFGEGGKIAPELTGSQRRNPEYILTKVLDPNATVPRDFQVTLIRTKRGRSITGVIKSDDGKVLVVQTPTEELRVAASDVADREPQRTSLMPENQLKGWPDADVRDLLAYLAGEEQVPLPKK